MREKNYTVYKFQELEPKVQERVLNYFRKNNDMPFLEDSLKELLLELLKEAGIGFIDNPELYYSLSHCQGDGVCFTGNFEYGLKNGDKTISIVVKDKNNYCHSNSVYITAYDKAGEEIDTPDSFRETYKAICDKIEKFGYADIEYQYSEEAIKENIEANDYEFFADGDIA